jgi:hypothetical protein
VVRRSLLLVLALPLIAAAPAHAGGFATAGLSSTPEGVAPGQPWKVEITVLQHGRTPLDGLTPRIRIESNDASREFTAVPTGRTGVYRAAVVFPKAGRWHYVVLDGFNDQLPHRFPAVRIGGEAASATAPAATAAPPAPDGAREGGAGGGLAAGWLWAAGAALVLALAVLGVDRRRRRPETAPSAPEPA